MKKFYILITLFYILVVSYAQPNIAVNFTTVSDTLPNGANSVKSFTITNSGTTNLNWSIDLADSLSNGPDFSFTKANNTNWALQSNQDRISNTVWITRALTKSLFNAKSEAASAAVSPEGTLWSVGSANKTINDSVFAPFSDANNGSPQSLIGDTITLYLTNEKIYYDVVFTSYSGGGSAGGFAYTRRQMMPWFNVSQVSGSLGAGAFININISFNASSLAAGLHSGKVLINSNDPDSPQKIVTAKLNILEPASINVLETDIADTLAAGASKTFDLHIENTGLAVLNWNINNPVTFTKANYEDYNLEDNQDRITDDVWITRQDREGIFNIAQETEYDRSGSYPSPLGTKWAYGKTADVSPSDYTTWRQSFRSMYSTSQLPGKTLSLKIESKDLYFDVLFNQWTSNGNGGGFSYTRTIPLPKWLSGTQNGTVSGNDTSIVTFSLDASGLLDGNYTFDLKIWSNDPAQPVFTVPLTLTVLGHPEISTDSDYDFGDVFNGIPKTYDLPVENTGSKLLIITNITTDSAEFVPLKTSVSIAPGTSATVPIVFTPSYLGFTRDTIRILSNDTVTPITKVVVEGTGIDLPDISISSFSFADTLVQDSVSTDTIIMTNTGETDLVWSLSANDDLAYYGSGFLFSFTKKPNTNINIAENRDSITPDISLTGNQNGLYDYDGDNLEWAMGSTFDALHSNTPYNSDWDNATNNQEENLPGKTISLHIINDDLYLDFHILSWGMNDAGNGYSYTRTAPMPKWLFAEGELSGDNGTLAPGDTEKIILTHEAFGILSNGVFNGSIVLSTNIPSKPEVIILNSMTIAGIDPEINTDTTSFSATLISEGISYKKLIITNNGTGKLVWQMDYPENADTVKPEKVTIYKFNNADWTLKENQDRITDLVWLTRADERGLFNIKEETEYDQDENTSPAGTEWAYGYTFELSPDDYDTWYNLHEQNTPELVGRPVSLHLIEEDLYFDIIFTGWQSDGDGGGFSYIRSEPYQPVPWLSVSPMNGMILPGKSREVSVILDASERIAGSYNAEMKLKSNDVDSPEILITASLNVIGIPEIELPVSELAFGEAFINFSDSLELTIKNVGNEVLNITNISFDKTVFSVPQTSLEVPPYDEIQLKVLFKPLLAQAYTGKMTITSDDPVNPTVEVLLSGSGALIPDITVNVTELTKVLFSGESEIQKFVVKNNGLGILNWYLGLDEMEVTFTKESNDNFLLEAHQDRITEDVWITRGATEGLYNIAQESSYERGGSWSSPLGTEWAYGKTSEVEPGDYTTWREAVRNRAGIRTDDLPGYTFSMKLTGYDAYYDVTFLEWERSGGAFSYIRKYVSGFLNPSWVTFSSISGTLGAGMSDTISAIFNPNSDINSGNFHLGMAVWSNDPDGPKNVPVSLTIDDVVANNPIADTLVQEGFASYTKKISKIFINGSGNPLSYSVESSNPLIATAVLSGDTLTINETGKGTVNITINANSQFGESGSQTFKLRINDAPSANPIANIRYARGFVSASIDISDVFNDSDPDVQNITVSSSQQTVVTASLSGKTLTISEVGSGVSTITLNTNDGFGGTVSVGFTVRVNSTPVVANPISNVEVDENFNIHIIDISDVFTDSDSDPLTLSASSSKENVVFSLINGSDLVLVESGTGTSTITVTASDNIVLVPSSTTFTVTVNPSTGVESIAKNNFTIYPNPSDGRITLALTDIYKNDVQITVFDIKGVQVYINTLSVYDKNLNLDLSSLEQGTYLIQFRSDDNIQYNKLIIE